MPIPQLSTNRVDCETLCPLLKKIKEIHSVHQCALEFSSGLEMKALPYPTRPARARHPTLPYQIIITLSPTPDRTPDFCHQAAHLSRFDFTCYIADPISTQWFSISTWLCLYFSDSVCGFIRGLLTLKSLYNCVQMEQLCVYTPRSKLREDRDIRLNLRTTRPVVPNVDFRDSLCSFRGV